MHTHPLFRNLIALLLLILLPGCKSSASEVTRDETWPDGRPKSRQTFKINSEGKEELWGKALYWYPSGAVEAEGEWARNRRHGPWTFYYENSNIKSKGEYAFGNKHGKWMDYNEDGAVLKEESFDNGKPIR